MFVFFETVFLLYTPPMPLFSYIGRSAEGKRVEGTMDASSVQEARRKIMALDILPEEVHELTQREQQEAVSQTASSPTLYAPLIDTLRIFAGWLLAWYALVYLVGAYEQQNRLPFSAPFLEGWFSSPLILRLTFGTYLFLLLTSLHRWMGRGIGKGILLTVFGGIVFYLFHINA